MAHNVAGILHELGKPIPPAREEIILIATEVIGETRRQDRKWGVRSQAPGLWIEILVEEVGESAQEGLRIRFDDKSSEDMETELIQCAAVAIQAVADLRKVRRENPRVI